MSGTRALAYTHDIVRGRTAVSMIGVVFFILATALGSYVRISVPGSPVPITLQTFFALMAGAVLGRKLGLASMIGYLAFGGVFLAGPTGGYVVGFAVAAYLTGYLLERRVPAIVSFAAGSAAIYACGAAWLALAYAFSPLHAVTLGVLPFVPGDLVKIVLAALIYSKISKRTKEIFSV